MAPCCPPCVADIAYDLSRLYLLTGGDADGRTVGVQRLQPSAMVDLDVIAVAVKTVGNGDDARLQRQGWVCPRRKQCRCQYGS